MRFWIIILIIALAFGCFFGIKGCIQANNKIGGLKHNYAIVQDSAKMWKDRYSTVHARKQIIQEQKEQIAFFYGAQIDSMARLLNIKPKHIKSIVYVPFQSNINLDSLKDALTSVDTVISTITDTITDRVDDRVGDRVNINGLMSLTKYEKGYGFLNLKKKQYLDVHFDNPVFKPLDVSGFDITAKPKHWGIGFYVGYGWDGMKMSPQIGIGIQYSLIRF